MLHAPVAKQQKNVLQVEAFTMVKQMSSPTTRETAIVVII